jgi:hypothetical protein
MTRRPNNGAITFGSGTGNGLPCNALAGTPHRKRRGRAINCRSHSRSTADMAPRLDASHQDENDR